MKNIYVQMWASRFSHTQKNKILKKWTHFEYNYLQKPTSALFFFNWDSLHARLNSHYEAWSYKKKKHKKD